MGGSGQKVASTRQATAFSKTAQNRAQKPVRLAGDPKTNKGNTMVFLRSQLVVILMLQTRLELNILLDL